MIPCQFELLVERRDLVASDPIQSDFADPQNSRAVEEFRNARQHFARQRPVIGFFGIHCDPAVVLNAVLRGAPRLELGELAEVVLEAVGRTAVPAGPECRLGDGGAAGQRHVLVVVGSTRHHVRVMIDVLHGRTSWLQRSYAPSALFRSSTGIGSVVGSLSNCWIWST